MAQQILSTNTFTTAKWIVSATASDGTHTTIAAALTSASSGDTIFIRPGTYTENPTLKAGVNLTAFGSDASLNGTGKVIISGTCTLSTAGSVTISGIQLQTNSAAFLAVTGSVASIVNLNNCFLNSSNNNGITYSSSSGSSAININYCSGDFGTTGISLGSYSGGGVLSVFNSIFTNSGATTTVTTCSAGSIQIFGSYFPVPFSVTSTGTLAAQFSTLDCGATNTTAFTSAGNAAAILFDKCRLLSGSASAVSIGTGTTVTLDQCSVKSSNTNVITGAGTLLYETISFPGSSQTINTTTQTGGLIKGGVAQAPSAGYIGEHIQATVAPAGNAISTITATNLTSISLTAGVWDVSLVMGYAGITTGTQVAAAISTSSTGLGTQGDSRVDLPISSLSSSNAALAIPSYRIVLTTTTTVYAVGYCTYTVGSGTFYGRISATRVG